MRLKFLITLFIIALFAAACGSVAEPPLSSSELTEAAAHAEAEEAIEAEAVEGEDVAEDADGEAVANAATEIPTEIPPTEVPPTATPLPPTETPLPPTEAPTEAEDQITRLVGLTGNADRGQELFNMSYDTAIGPYMCATCHSIEPEVRLIGPSLWNIYETAETRVEGESPSEYIYHSIIAPNDYIVEAEPPYPEGLMPPNYSELLSDQEIYHIIAYLQTLDE